MKVEKCVKESFVVIGKEGSTLDGEDFIQRLWVDANTHVVVPSMPKKTCWKLKLKARSHM